MDDLLSQRLFTNSLNFKTLLERIIEKYSKVQYQDDGIEVDLNVTSTEMLESYMRMSRANLEKLDSKSLTDLREESMRAQDITTDYQMDVTYQDGGTDETTQFSVDDEGSTFNSTEFQPEDQDQELELSLRRHGSLVELYPSMLRRIGQAWQRQQASEAAGSVLRRYRRWRQQNRSGLGNTFIVTLRDTSTRGRTLLEESSSTVPTMSPRRAAPVQSVLVMDLTAPEESSLNQTFVVSETSWLGARTSALSPSRPSRRLSVGSLQSNATFLSDTSGVTERPDIYGSPVRPRMLGGLSRSPQTFSRSPRAQSVETFSRGPRVQSLETFSRSPRVQSLETFSRSPRVQSLETSKSPKAQSVETFSWSPRVQSLETSKSPRKQSVETFSWSPRGPRVQSLETARSPRAQSVETFSRGPRVQSLETSKSPRKQSVETFSWSPRGPRVQSLETSKSPKAQSVETFSWSPRGPRVQSLETSRSPRAQSGENFFSSPRGSRAQSLENSSWSPRVQSMETFSKSPRSPRGPRVQSVETFSREPLRLRLVSPQKPLRVLYPPDSHQPLQPGPGGHRGLRRHLSFDSALPSPSKLDADFLKLYHKLVCQNKSSFFSGVPCRLCARSAHAGRGPSSSSSSLAALALSPHRSLLRKRHRELDWDKRRQAKRCRDELSSPGSGPHRTEMMRRYLTPTQPTFSPERRPETWMTQRRHVTAADFSGIGSSPERRTTIGSSPRKW